MECSRLDSSGLWTQAKPSFPADASRYGYDLFLGWMEGEIRVECTEISQDIALNT